MPGVKKNLIHNDRWALLYMYGLVSKEKVLGNRSLQVCYIYFLVLDAYIESSPIEAEYHTVF